MDLEEFVGKWDGKGIDFDGSFGFQCMDLMHQYILEICELPGTVLKAPTAFQAFERGNDAFETIKAVPGAIPAPGDIIFWGLEVGEAGHVAIFMSGDENSFISFDQNWPVGTKCHKQNHDNRGVVGWLRLKNNEEDMTKEEIEKIVNDVVNPIKEQLALLENALVEAKVKITKRATKSQARKEAIEIVKNRVSPKRLKKAIKKLTGKNYDDSNK